MKNITKALLLLSACTFFSINLSAEGREERALYQSDEGSGSYVNDNEVENTSESSIAKKIDSKLKPGLKPKPDSQPKPTSQPKPNTSQFSLASNSNPTVKDIQTYVQNAHKVVLNKETKEDLIPKLVIDLNQAFANGKGVLAYNKGTISRNFSFTDKEKRYTEFKRHLTGLLEKLYKAGKEVKNGDWGNKTALLSTKEQTGIPRLLYYGYERFYTNETRTTSDTFLGWYNDLIKK